MLNKIYESKYPRKLFNLNITKTIIREHVYYKTCPLRQKRYNFLLFSMAKQSSFDQTREA